MQKRIFAKEKKNKFYNGNSYITANPLLEQTNFVLSKNAFTSTQEISPNHHIGGALVVAGGGATGRGLWCQKWDGMEESLQEFASRVQQLARDAHPSLVTEAVEPMAVDAFLRGCKEKLAAYSALNREPATVELAVNLVEGAVTNQQAVFGSTVPVSKLRQVLRFENPTQTQPDDYQVRAVHASSVEGLEAATERRFRQCEGALVEVKAGMSSLGEQMKEVMSLGSFQAKDHQCITDHEDFTILCLNPVVMKNCLICLNKRQLGRLYVGLPTRGLLGGFMASWA
ncbi:hypothetical protein CAPTEDRAFT_208362 [Capitella teleta]|uniref:Uncharacterized protein n=1 Tax=Capitella teleta TaxID=283909 RepID=R7VHK7_CAPTE|nr:hypothetical protein CAPTEDRAFT_208362 [Capitella teleta]|eukprot:ELU15776.1 hypothetical protein CAPTEDRAFT_208362 [Capitella teleta]